jgi:hypothetical protein
MAVLMLYLNSLYFLTRPRKSKPYIPRHFYTFFFFVSTATYRKFASSAFSFTDFIFLIPSFVGLPTYIFPFILYFLIYFGSLRVFHSIDVVLPSVSIICNPFIYTIDVLLYYNFKLKENIRHEISQITQEIKRWFRITGVFCYGINKVAKNSHSMEHTNCHKLRHYRAMPET